MTARLRALGLMLLLCACADDFHRVDESIVEPRTDAIELIGVAGRRLEDGDVYRVPLDYPDKSVAPDSRGREAFVLINDTDAPVLVLSLVVIGAEPDEWSLYAPVRGHDIPLAVSGLRLDAGLRIDFDVGFRPRAEGERSATLELVVERAGRVEARVIELRARCARGPP